MDIREAELRDVESLQRNCFDRTPVEEVRRLVEGSAARSVAGESILLVVADGGEVIGNVTVTRNAHRLQRHRAHLGGFVIHPSAQGRGIARELATAAAKWALELGCELLELDCRGGTRAEDAYRGLGFEEWGRLPAGFTEDAGTFDQVCLYVRIEKWLAAQPR